MSEPMPTAVPSAGSAEPATPSLSWVVAGLSAGAAVIHFAMIPAHAGGSLVDPMAFAVAGWFQLWVAGAILANRAGRGTMTASFVGNLAIALIWIWSRTVGLPVGSHAGTAEEWGTIDVVANLLGIGAALVSARLLLAPERQRSSARLAPALAAVAALGLATTVITSPDAATHGGSGHAHDGTAAAAGADHHGTDPAAHAALMTELDKTRCDEDFNHASYWKETAELGIDTYQGGAMATDDHSTGATTTTSQPDPTGGRGSETLDKLIGMTESAGVSEAGAAQLVIALGEASDEEYEQWLWWLRSSGTVGGGHGHDSAAPGDSGGHGGHVGPQPWVAMTDQEQCDQLEEELARARAVTEKYDTVAKVEAGGWQKVTGYVPGIAAHYIKYSAVDRTFDIDEPEMILFDGTEPNSRVIGLSYYLIHDATAEPTQGFTGPNDHFHRHVGLCTADNGVIIGDSQTTEEECEARGGHKASGDSGWMNHVWVVPGCESPWGMFSAATPVVEGALGRASGDGEGGCANSGVRDRYGMGSGPSMARSSGGN